MTDPTPHDRRSPMEHERDDVTPLRKLIEAVEKGTFLLDAIPAKYETTAYQAFSGSLDAANALHVALLPGWDWGVSSSNAAAVFSGKLISGPSDLASADNPARAWLLAILLAYDAGQK